jgi:hypothetical protein
MKTILFVGATGAQGGAAVKYLSTTGEYRILALTRSGTSPHAQEMAAIPNVELVVSAAASGYDTEAFLAAASKSDYVFVNTDGFTLGEQAETYWGIRLFELAVRAGVKHFVYSGLDYASKASGYDPKFYCGHYEGKARVEGKHIQHTFDCLSWGNFLTSARMDACPKRLPHGVEHHQIGPVHGTPLGRHGSVQA